MCPGLKNAEFPRRFFRSFATFSIGEKKEWFWVPLSGDDTVATSDQTRLEEENQKLRETLAEFGVHRQARKPSETLQEENRRLQEDVRWYLGMLKDA